MGLADTYFQVYGSTVSACCRMLGIHYWNMDVYFRYIKEFQEIETVVKANILHANTFKFFSLNVFNKLKHELLQKITKDEVLDVNVILKDFRYLQIFICDLIPEHDDLVKANDLNSLQLQTESTNLDLSDENSSVVNKCSLDQDVQDPSSSKNEEKDVDVVEISGLTGNKLSELCLLMRLSNSPFLLQKYEKSKLFYIFAKKNLSSQFWRILDKLKIIIKYWSSQNYSDIVSKNYLYYNYYCPAYIYKLINNYYNNLDTNMKKNLTDYYEDKHLELIYKYRIKEEVPGETLQRPISPNTILDKFNLNWTMVKEELLPTNAQYDQMCMKEINDKQEKVKRKWINGETDGNVIKDKKIVNEERKEQKNERKNANLDGKVNLNK